MKYELDNKIYDVIIKRKGNKNTYIRVENNIIIITTGYFITNNKIKKILDDNIKFLRKCFSKKNKDGFYIMGNEYKIIYDENVLIEINDDVIKVKNEKILNKWYKDKIILIFKERLDYYYSIFSENIPYPLLKIRDMKTRWGVCNRKNNTITLNLNLIKYDYDCLDYVIVHELSHFVHFNHSKEFWSTVSKYYPNYKETQKKLKN